MLTYLAENGKVGGETVTAGEYAVLCRRMLTYAENGLTYADVCLQVGGLAVTAGDLRVRLSAILAVELPENEFTWREPKHRLGMTGGMGLYVCMYMYVCMYVCMYLCM